MSRMLRTVQAEAVSACGTLYAGHLSTLLLLVLFSFILFSCRDDGPTVPVPWAVSAVGADEEETILAWRASYESIPVSIRGCGPETKAVIVSAGADWLTLKGDTLAVDSIVTFATRTNDTGVRRTATFTFTDADDATRQATLTVTQLSASDGNTNGADARQDLYIGYGYDIYKALESPMAVRTKQPIIDIDFLRRENIESNYEIIQDCRITRTETRYVCTNNIHAFGQNLTQQQTNDKDNILEGCRENSATVEQLLASAKGKLEQNNIGHGSLEKAVASRVIDRGALIDLRRRRGIPFTDGISTLLWNIQHMSGQPRYQAIEEMLAEYGTHVIIQADLGGRIDYTFTMLKQTAFNSVQEMREEIDYTLGRIADSERTDKSRTPTTLKSHSGAITVSGGSKITRERLEDDIRGLNAAGQIDPGHITDWLASINNTGNPESDPNLEIIHFELIPLWDLVEDDLRGDFRDATFRLASRSSYALPSSFLGLDIYEFHTKQFPSLFNFTYTNANSSLCRLLYFENEPVLEVCSEYVPKIRTDARVTVAYPIYKQHIRLNQGLFLGDGIHQPAYVGFSGADCYVSPIADMAPGSMIETFCYVNGNLTLNKPISEAGQGKNGSIQDEYLYLYGEVNGKNATTRHPIVKVGSTFWSRHDINHHMYFAATNTGVSSDQLQDGVLYTLFQYEPNRQFQGSNSWTWGYDPNTYYADKPNTKWYLPMADEVRQLYAYLGFNPKALFKGQVSGWDAEFNGYYGMSDLKNGARKFSGGKRELHYKGEMNVISSRNKNADRTACLMVLNPDYTIQLIDDSTFPYPYLYDWRTNYYPVRVVRGYLFEYPLLTTIKSHLK